MTADDRCVLPCAAHHSAIALAVTMLTAGYVPTTALGHVTTSSGGGMQAPTAALSATSQPRWAAACKCPPRRQPPRPHRYEFGQVTSLAGPDGRYGTQLLMLCASLIASLIASPIASLIASLIAPPTALDEVEHAQCVTALGLPPLHASAHHGASASSQQVRHCSFCSRASD